MAERVKYNIRKHSILFCKELAKSKRDKENKLSNKYEELSKIFQDNPCEETKIAMERTKIELENLYDEKVNGIITRARARWHEHGETNSKYFFNLEKRNHIRKHIRTLHVSGVITTDPFKIGEAQADYYKKLYKSRETDLNALESKQFFKDTNIPKLSNDMRSLCEGEIKMQECENVLQSFAIGKTPGNDGLPIEFYKTFWSTV